MKIQQKKSKIESARCEGERERVIQKYQSNAIQQHTKQTDTQSARKREKRTKNKN